MKKTLLCGVFFLLSVNLYTLENINYPIEHLIEVKVVTSLDECLYIEQSYKQFFIEMFTKIATPHKKNIPLSLLLSQVILESNFGTSDLALNACNYAGIKDFYWKGESYKGYRKYASIKEFIEDYVVFLNKPHYQQYLSLSLQDCINGISKKYAEDDKYAEKLLFIINKYKLYD